MMQVNLLQKLGFKYLCLQFGFFPLFSSENDIFSAMQRL